MEWNHMHYECQTWILFENLLLTGFNNQYRNYEFQFVNWWLFFFGCHEKVIGIEKPVSTQDLFFQKGK